MFPWTHENVSTWLGDWRIVAVSGNTLPPRDPDDDDEEEDEDEEDDDDETDEEPAVVREPDE